MKYGVGISVHYKTRFIFVILNGVIVCEDSDTYFFEMIDIFIQKCKNYDYI